LVIVANDVYANVSSGRFQTLPTQSGSQTFRASASGPIQTIAHDAANGPLTRIKEIGNLAGIQTQCKQDDGLELLGIQ